MLPENVLGGSWKAEERRPKSEDERPEPEEGINDFNR
jgi:hypothetical protein